MPTEILELKHYHVDVNPQYADSIEADVFKIHMMFETDESVLESIRAHQDPSVVANKVYHQLPDFIKDGRDAFEIGLDEVGAHSDSLYLLLIMS